MFMKREEKVTLLENLTEALAVKNDLLSIGALEHDMCKDSNIAGKKTQASSRKSLDKYSFDFDTLAKSLKQLTNEFSDLKRKTIESSSSNKPYKPFFKKNNNLSAFSEF